MPMNFFDGALTSSIYDEKVERFVGCERLGETLSALHANLGLNFALEREFIRCGSVTVEYRFLGFFVGMSTYAQMKLGKGGGLRPMFWTDADPNWFSDYLVDVLGGGFELYPPPLELYEFGVRGPIAEVPPFSTGKELKMKLALRGMLT